MGNPFEAIDFEKLARELIIYGLLVLAASFGMGFGCYYLVSHYHVTTKVEKK